MTFWHIQELLTDPEKWRKRCFCAVKCIEQFVFMFLSPPSGCRSSDLQVHGRRSFLCVLFGLCAAAFKQTFLNFYKTQSLRMREQSVFENNDLTVSRSARIAVRVWFGRTMKNILLCWDGGENTHQINCTDRSHLIWAWVGQQGWALIRELLTSFTESFWEFEVSWKTDWKTLLNQIQSEDACGFAKTLLAHPSVLAPISKPLLFS